MAASSGGHGGAGRRARGTRVIPSLNMAGAKITPVNNGPLRIEGDFEMVDPSGAVFGLAGRSAISLCRCGHSENKPFCDGSHKRQDFRHEVVARELAPPTPKP